ncbi:hypothetical protein GLOTRDRAFT_124721 [Gloeophyllum trabeum ATCC 11539]|uniref:Mitochondrial import inner membrane translocase subunit Tim21 n=1 Tax=Gloeophyllum trabeum (strain ATCC 11539 / FP-39264 / Madison 617) TaxID=670483 RepID=S7QPE3_GLOTA|nr:uncharacterized protein GLOTRDRAFT_124721 [Gloeophyllum trabeum ATCC 11539]EPQ61441.1 hypothetical protein GLOTRDRAFT_124721 [Gloeophyllum trabeum ATCC 11539]
MSSRLVLLSSRLTRSHNLAKCFKSPPRNACRRAFATHRDPVVPSSLLSQALDQRQRAARREDSVGPFQLGIVPPTPDEVDNVKKWSELSAGGKVARATARTTSLTVILFGAGLSAMLIYALTSELFSRNSPTVLYSEACDKIKESPRVARYLPGPLVFHNNPPSSFRPRHRNHQVSSQVVTDASGKEHLLLNFYVHSRASESTFSASADSSFASIGNWIKDSTAHVSELSWDEYVAEMKVKANAVAESTQRLVRYLAGKPEPPRPRDTSTAVEPVEEKKEEKGRWWNLAGVFGSLRGAVGRGSHENASPTGDGKVWTDGEVHADLVKDTDGYFRFRYILVDIPNSRTRTPIRVFVERASDVRENEPVWRFQPS